MASTIIFSASSAIAFSWIVGYIMEVQGQHVAIPIWYLRDATRNDPRDARLILIGRGRELPRCERVNCRSSNPDSHVAPSLFSTPGRRSFITSVGGVICCWSRVDTGRRNFVGLREFTCPFCSRRKRRSESGHFFRYRRMIFSNVNPFENLACSRRH